MKKWLFFVLPIFIFFLLFPFSIQAEELSEMLQQELFPGEVFQGQEMSVEFTGEPVEKQEVLIETKEEPVEEGLISPFLGNVKGVETSYSAEIFKKESTRSALEVRTLSNLGLPGVSLTRNSFFYFLRNWEENVKLFFKFSKKDKIEYLLKLNERRLAESFILIEEKEFEKAKESLEEFDDNLVEINDLINSLDESEIEEGLVRKIETNVVKQQSVIDFFEERVNSSYDISDWEKMRVLSLERAIEVLVYTNTRFPSFSLKQRILDVLDDNYYSEETKDALLTKMTEKLRKEIREENLF